MAVVKSDHRRPGELWWNYRGGWMPDIQRHRIVFIDYYDRKPCNVVTEEHWDHTGEPWFKPGIDKPTGTCAAYWDFDWSKRDGTLYFYQSGVGGDPLSAQISPFVRRDPPPGLIWAAPEVRFHRWLSKAKPDVAIRSDATLLAMGYRRLSRPLVLAGNGWGMPKGSRNPFSVAEETDSHLAYCKICDDHFPSDAECKHLEWCDRCASLVYVDTHVREDEPDGKPVIHGPDEEDDES
jgi:hypothetical protein